MEVLIAAVFLGAAAARGDAVVKSDFVFQANDSVFNSPEFDLQSQLTGQSSFSLPDTVIQDIAPVAVSGISGQASYALKTSTPQIYLGAELAVLSTSLTTTITIQRVAVNADVFMVSGRTTIVTHVQGECTGIPLTLIPGKADLYGAILVTLDDAGLPVIQVPYFEATWGADSWQVGAFHCTGVEGFKDKVQAGILKYLADPGPFQAQLKSMVSARATAAQAQVRAWFNQVKPVSLGINGLTVTMVPQSIRNVDGEKFQVAGQLNFAFASKTVATSQLVSGASGPDTSSVNAASGFALFVPQTLLSSLALAAHSTGFFNIEEVGQNIQGFKDFLASSVEEALVWPELTYYQANADFRFDLSSGAAPALSALTDNGNGTVSQALNGGLSMKVLSPTLNPATNAAGLIPMVTFAGPFQASYTLSLSAGASPQITLTLNQIALNSSATWDPSYSASILRNPYVNVATLQDHVVSAMAGMPFSVAVSPMTLTQSLSLTPSSLESQANWMQINWR